MVIDKNRETSEEEEPHNALGRLGTRLGLHETRIRETLGHNVCLIGYYLCRSGMRNGSAKDGKRRR